MALTLKCAISFLRTLKGPSGYAKTKTNAQSKCHRAPPLLLRAHYNLAAEIGSIAVGALVAARAVLLAAFEQP